jgi:hypothetical protein
VVNEQEVILSKRIWKRRWNWNLLLFVIMVASTIDACTQTCIDMHTLHTHIMTHTQTHTKGCKSWATHGGWGEIFNWKKGFEFLILNTYNLIQFWLIFHWVNMPDHLHWFLLGFTYHAWILWEFLKDKKWIA